MKFLDHFTRVALILRQWNAEGAQRSNRLGCGRDCPVIQLLKII
jgi:hypothetical protein